MTEQPPLPFEPIQTHESDAFDAVVIPIQILQPDLETKPDAEPFRDPYSTKKRINEKIIERRDGEDLGAEQTGFKDNVIPINTEPPASPAQRQGSNQRHPAGKERPIAGPVRGEVDVHAPDYFGRPVVLSQEEKASGHDRVRAARKVLRAVIPADQPRNSHQ